MKKIPGSNHKTIKLFVLGLGVFVCCSLPFTLHPSPFTSSVYAADIQISASVDRNSLGLNDQLALQVDVSGDASNIPNPVIPSLNDFTAYSSGRSQNMSIVNGKVSSSISFHYILVPRTAGKFTIPPIKLDFDGKTYQTNPIEITVTQNGSQPQQQGNTSSQQTYEPDRQHSSRNSSDAIYVTGSVDKNSVYVNEQITYTFKFYRRINLLSRPQFAQPNFSGFWTEDLPPKEYMTTINGSKYAVSEIKFLAFPSKPGNLTISEASLRCQVQDFNRQNPFDDDFFAGFFSQGQEKILATKPITINVKRLPEKGKPADFSGTVGSFKITAEIDKQKLKANEPANLKITLSGTGNMKTIEDPKLPDWPDFRKYETMSSLNVNKDSGVLSGSKVFTTVIVPQTQGTKTIPPVTFSFFNISKNQYETIKTQPITLEVKPGDPGSTLTTAAPPSGFKPAPADIKVVNKDIAYIRLSSKLTDYDGAIYTKPWFILVNLLAVFIYFMLFIYIKWTEKLSENVAFARSLKASGVSKRYLRQAKKLLDSNKPLDFYTAISRALIEYIANKTNTSPEGLTCALINEMLLKRNVSKQVLEDIKILLDECDMARFAPSAVNASGMESIYEKTGETINRLDKEL